MGNRATSKVKIFYVGFDIDKKTIPVYIHTLPLISFIKIHPSFTRVRACFILLQQKTVSDIVYLKN